MFISLEKEPSSPGASAVASASPLAGLELDDTQEQLLLSIARQHCRLAVEYSKANTNTLRRRQIIEEIQSLRTLRDDLIAKWQKVALS